MAIALFNTQTPTRNMLRPGLRLMIGVLSVLFYGGLGLIFWGPRPWLGGVLGLTALWRGLWLIKSAARYYGGPAPLERSDTWE